MNKLSKVAAFLFVLAVSVIGLSGKSSAIVLKGIEDGALHASAGSGLVTTAGASASLTGTGARWTLVYAGTLAQNATFNFWANGVSISTLSVTGGSNTTVVKGEYAFLAKNPIIYVSGLSAGTSASVLIEGGYGAP